MRGKKAKILRRMAASYVKHQLKKPLGEGYNLYHQADNRISMEPVLDEDGYPRRDEEGVPLVAPKPMPGTIHCGWHVRVIYQKLKVMTKGRDICARNRQLGSG